MSEQEFRVGDRVRFKPGHLPSSSQGFHSESEEFTVKCVNNDGNNAYLFTQNEASSRGAYGDICSCGKHRWVEQSDDIEIIGTKLTNMNLKEKMALVFKGEPQKSFIKAGIMNSDETLTSDGKDVFMAWLLKQNGDAFKTEVVDPILADEESK